MLLNSIIHVPNAVLLSVYLIIHIRNAIIHFLDAVQPFGLSVLASILCYACYGLLFLFPILLFVF